MKPEFIDINYQDDLICWGVGNNAVSPRMIAKIILREPNSKEEELLKLKYDKSKEIYDTYINLGQRLKPLGSSATSAEAKITFIHPEKMTVTWLQDNLTNDQKSRGLKPARGKWTIMSMIQMYLTKEIDFI